MRPAQIRRSWLPPSHHTMTAVLVNGFDFKIVDKCHGDLKSMQTAIGGFLEQLAPTSHKTTMSAFVDEEGMMTVRPLNFIGGIVAARLGFMVSDLDGMGPCVFGPILFTSSKEGASSLTKNQVEYIKSIFDELTADEEESESD